MKNEYKTAINSPWLRSLLFLAIVYFSQVYPFYHLHHFHDDGALEFEISSHPIEVDLDHPSDHHHNEDIPHTNDHQHSYDKQINWHILRIQNPTRLTFDNQFSVAQLPYVFTNNNRGFSIDYQTPLFIDNRHVSRIIIRGPPLLG